MSMGGGGGGGGGGDDEAGGLFTEMNVTPLVDIFLVLLIIFMVTATGLTTASLDVALPKAATPGSLDASKTVTVSIDEKNRFFMDKAEVGAEALESTMRAALSKTSDGAIILAGDRTVPLDRLVLAMEAARKAGAKRFAIAVAREEAR